MVYSVKFSCQPQFSRTCLTHHTRHHLLLSFADNYLLLTCQTRYADTSEDKALFLMEIPTLQKNLHASPGNGHVPVPSNQSPYPLSTPITVDIFTLPPSFFFLFVFAAPLFPTGVVIPRHSTRLNDFILASDLLFPLLMMRLVPSHFEVDFQHSRLYWDKEY